MDVKLGFKMQGEEGGGFQRGGNNTMDRVV